MSTKYKKGLARIAVTFLSFSTALTAGGASLAVPLVAQADHTTAHTIEQLQATIADLTAKIAALSGGGSGAGAALCTFTRSLYSGVSAGEDARCLQKYLNSAGFQVSASGAGSAVNETTSFGPKTKMAVAKWQAANGVSPAAGVFGPLSRAKYTSLMGGTTPPPPPGPPGPPPPPTVGTGLRVDPGTQPANSLSPESAARVPYTRVKLTAANDGDVVVKSITVERTGFMADAAISGIVLLDEDGNQISTVEKSLNANHQVVLNDLFTVPKGTSKEYTIAANMAADNDARAGQVGYLSVQAVDASPATVTGSFPIVGAGHTVNGTLAIGSVTMDKGSNDPSSSPTKEVGTTNYVFSSIKMTVGSQEDVMLERIRWNQSGSAGSADLKNIAVYDNKGNKYDVTVSADGKYYTAKIGSGIRVNKGDIAELYIKGDIESGAARTIDFDVYRRTDLVVKGLDHKFYITPPNGASDPTDDSSAFSSVNPWYDASQVTVGNGSLRVEKSNTVTGGNVAVGGSNQAIGAFTFEAKGEPITYTSLVLTIVSTDADSGGEKAELTNVTIYDKNGGAVAGPKDLVKTSITFTDSVTVPIGVNTYTVKGKLGSTGWENNDTIVVGLRPPSTAISSVTGQVTGNTITPTPASNVDANTQTVKAPALAVSPSTSLIAQNVIRGANQMEVGRYNLDAGSSGDDMKVNIVKIRMVTSGSLDPDEFNTIALYDGTATTATLLGTATNPSGNADGDDVTVSITLDTSLIILKGVNKIVSLRANSATTIGADDTVRFDFSGSITNGDWTVLGQSTGTEITETFSTSAGSLMTFKVGGGYEITEDTSAGQTEGWYPDGSTGVTVAAFKVRATSETIAVKDFQVQLTNTASSTAADIAMVYLYEGSKLIAKRVPTFQSRVENFSFNTTAAQGDGSAAQPTNFLEVPADTFKIVTVKVDLPTLNSQSCQDSATPCSGRLIAVDTGPGSSVKHKGVGRGSGVEYSPAVYSSGTTSGTTSVTGVRYFRAVPKVELVTLPSGTSLASGVKVYRWKVTAQGGDIGVYKFTLKMSTSGGAALLLDSAKIVNETEAKDMTNSITLATSSVTQCGDTTGDGSGGCTFDTSGNIRLHAIVDNTTNYSDRWVRISSGASHTFALQIASVTLTATTGEKVTTQLFTDASYPTASSTGLGQTFMFKRGAVEADRQDDFIWTDFTAEATSSATNADTSDWTNGFRVDNFFNDLDAVTVTE